MTLIDWLTGSVRHSGACVISRFGYFIRLANLRGKDTKTCQNAKSFIGFPVRRDFIQSDSCQDLLNEFCGLSVSV